MRVSFLVNHPHYVNQIAQWYFDEWACMSSTATVEKVAKDVSAKAKSTHDFPLAFIVHDMDTLYGVAELKIRENKNYPQYEHWLGGVFVAPENRGEGIAGLLIKSAQDHASVIGVEELYLQCETHNITLYKKYGFQALHEADYGAESITIMSWKTNM